MAINIKEGIRAEIEGRIDTTIKSLWIKLPDPRSDKTAGKCYHPQEQKLERDLEMRKKIREVSKRDRVVRMGVGPLIFSQINWVNLCSGHEREISQIS